MSFEVEEAPRYIGQFDTNCDSVQVALLQSTCLLHSGQKSVFDT